MTRESYYDLAESLFDSVKPYLTDAQISSNEYLIAGQEYELLLGNVAWAALQNDVPLPSEMLDYAEPEIVGSLPVADAIKTHFTKRMID
jgi:hypothetical protein